MIGLILALSISWTWTQAAERGGARGGARAGAARGGAAAQETNDVTPAESRVLQRDGLEILTFETEEDYNELQRRCEESQRGDPAPGTYTVQYFRSRTDGSVQPYSLWLPKGYVDSDPMPLIVQLHGLGQKTISGMRLTWKGMQEAAWIDHSAPVIIVNCLGRTNASYEGMAEVDILETIDEVQRRFSVNPDRVYIMGHSMGGGGAFKIGLHYPDHFGAITPCDPAMDRSAPSDSTPDWIKPQANIQYSENLFPNARNLEVLFKWAGNGVGGANKLSYSEAINALGGFATDEILPGMPHGFGAVRPYALFVTEATWKPIQRNPPEVKFYTNTLEYNQAYWVTIDRLDEHNADASIDAVLVGGQPAGRGQGGQRRGGAAAGEAAAEPSLTITTKNIGALTLRLEDAGASGKSIPLKVDGQEVMNGELPAVAYLNKTGDKWAMADAPAAAGKRHGLQGPIGAAFDSAFLAVYGDGDRDLAINELDFIRNPAGRMSIQGDFPMKAAGKVTDEDVRKYNLLLFGTPQTNPVLARIADKLPAGLMNADHSGDNGVVFIYPNPENPERYVVVWSARMLSADIEVLRAQRLPIFMVPDYVKIAGGAIETAGFFDNDWKLKP